jgi:hypothetical protein
MVELREERQELVDHVVARSGAAGVIESAPHTPTLTEISQFRRN